MSEAAATVTCQGILTERDDTVVTAVCDIYEDRIEQSVKYCKEKKNWDVYGTKDYPRAYRKRRR